MRSYSNLGLLTVFLQALLKEIILSEIPAFKLISTAGIEITA